MRRRVTDHYVTLGDPAVSYSQPIRYNLLFNINDGHGCVVDFISGSVCNRMPGVGKTSMVVRYLGKMFSHHISPTIGASFFTCNINLGDTKVKLQVWDTAGQERFRSMAPMYYRNANAALLVYDITQMSTFNSIKSWVKELQRNVEDPMILCVVGNKTDLESQRKVPKEEAIQYATSIAACYFESSALNDTGIEDIFLCCANDLITLNQDQSVSYNTNVQEKNVPNGRPISLLSATEKRTCC
ncbi:ras-related protein Rab-31-like isoform X4 [Cimex lectularius]|uniref:Uncharacterized protein n=1 Tax=Cimex lectularius TaxID=79782 RepID=A0A8I6SST9_CIMLE|nr:ras-related protein Rab-31-like isoform X4 [Cimex lectularius]